MHLGNYSEICVTVLASVCLCVHVVHFQHLMLPYQCVSIHSSLHITIYQVLEVDMLWAKIHITGIFFIIVVHCFEVYSFQMMEYIVLIITRVNKQVFDVPLMRNSNIRVSH